MTDHRANDLSYGHLGEATYDAETKQWGFSRLPHQDYNIQQVLPLKQNVAGSIRVLDEIRTRPSHYLRSQGKWITKAYPETWPANVQYSSLLKAPSAEQSNWPSTSGNLLAIGKAQDIAHRSAESRTAYVIAMSSGAAGEVLQLSRPRMSYVGWETKGPKISILDPSSEDDAFWTGNGGTIQQIVFADEEEEVGSWFAVRQAGIITLFRPHFCNSSAPASVPPGYSQKYPASRLVCNPVTSMSMKQSMSEEYVDVSFNPWYNRQLAIVDKAGQWSIWDIEGREHKRTHLELICGKRGEMHDTISNQQTSRLSGGADGWHRVLWAGGVSTVVVLSRLRIAVFDVKARPSLLKSPDLILGNSLDWILDVKRSPNHLNHLFVLTSSRVFWIEVVPAGEEKNMGICGARILLSYRHFRDGNDETMKLTTFNEGDASIVLITSTQSTIVHFLRFENNTDGAIRPTILSKSINLPIDVDVNTTSTGLRSKLQTLCVIPSYFSIGSANLLPGFGMKYMEQKRSFSQLWLLGEDLSLTSCLYSQSISPAYEGQESTLEPIRAPHLKTFQGRNRKESARTKDSFVVPDGLESYGSALEKQTRLDYTSDADSQAQEADLTFSMRSVFRKAFYSSAENRSSEGATPQYSQSIEEILGNIQQKVQVGKQAEELPAQSLLELADFDNFSGNFDQAGALLHEYVASLSVGVNDSSIATIVSDLIGFSGLRIDHLEDSDNNVTRLLQIYDQLVRSWVTSLPRTVSGQIRLAKFKIIRKISFELCLSSLAVSLQNVSTKVPEVKESEPSQHDLVLSLREKSRRPSRATTPSLMSSQSVTTDTASIRTDAASSASEPLEDSSIIRLRQYAVSIKSRPDISSGPTWLSDWPSTPGGDPNHFSWEQARSATAAAELNSEDEHDQVPRREEARRRRRIERFLRRERASASQRDSSQSEIHKMFGSQSEAIIPPPFSSQVVEDVPMTQPNRGVFGSRTVRKSPMKKQKKRRAAGF